MPLVADATQPRWVLKRNCALTPRCAALACLAPALLALVIAAALWRLSGHGGFIVFALLEGAGMAAAFIVYSRHAGDRETVHLHDGQLDIEQRHGLTVRRMAWPVNGVRLAQGAPDAPLCVQARGQSVRVGSGLTATERRCFARALRQALQRAG